MEKRIERRIERRIFEMGRIGEIYALKYLSTDTWVEPRVFLCAKRHCCMGQELLDISSV